MRFSREDAKLQGREVCRVPKHLYKNLKPLKSRFMQHLPVIRVSDLDEGFGALDADNMGTMHSLFDFLKSNFEFIIIISHLDAMRDMVDKQLEVRKENGFSKIDNSAS